MNPLGKWNELGIFFGIGTLLSLISLEIIRPTRFFQVLLWLALVVSIIFLAIINFSLIWMLIAAFSLIFFVYILSTSTNDKEKDARRLSWISLSLLVISLFFILAGNIVGGYIAKKINVQSFEVRPSWSATFEIAGKTFKENPVLGAGPNRFLTQWFLHKPAGVNLTNFWNTHFVYGVGLIPSSLITSGTLGFLSWIIFLGFFLYIGFKALFFKGREQFSQYLVVSSFFVSLYLWAVAFFYTPDLTIFTLTFFFTGLFVAALSFEHIIPVKTISFTDHPRISFISILFVVFLLISTVSFGYLVIQNGLSSAYFEKGLIAFSQGNMSAAETEFSKAVALDKKDLYHRSLVEVNLVRLQQIATQEDISSEAVRSNFQRILASTLDNARKAVEKDPTNYQNWLVVGKVYELMVELRVQGAYENAEIAYTEALKRNPFNPAINLERARLEIARADFKKAKEYIAGALQQKQNYTEAIFLLSQIEVTEGNVNGAISSVESATLLSPDDPLVFFRLGLLKYNKKDYKGAAKAFEQAVALNPVYANARYFLGLSYYQDRRSKDAILQFEAVQSTNPDNAEVKLILANLKAGKSPFADVTPPLDDEPEKRDNLPVDENASENSGE
ncbi:MAG: tetratricopeptide repeat protein [Patescibacteria group bacterium]